MYDAIEFRGNDQADVEALAEHAGVPVYNGLTNEWHPTQMLADFLTMHEASDKPYDAARLRVRRRLPLQHGPVAAGHGRADGQRRPAGGPGRAAAAQGRRRSSPRRSPAAPAPGSRSPTTRRRPSHGVDFVHTDVWVSMGESKDVWTDRVRLLAPYQVNADAAGSDREPGGQVHALPAGLPRLRTRSSAREIMEHTGMSSRPRGHGRGLRVARPASSSTRPRTACTPSRRSSSPPSPDTPRGAVAVTGRPAPSRRRGRP